MAKFLLYLKAGIVHCRITHDAKKVEISTGQKIDSTKWDTDKKRMKGAGDLATSVNKRLETVVAKLRNIESDLQHRNVVYSAKMIKDLYEGKGVKEKGFLETFRLLMEHMQDEHAESRPAEGTIKSYQTRIKNVEAYVSHRYKTPDLFFHQIDEDFLEGLKKYLMKERGFGLGHTSKHLEAAKAVVKFAVRRKYTKENYVQHMPVPKPNYAAMPIFHLSREQLEMLETSSFPGKLQEIADCAIFQAHTGLSYRELYDLVPDWMIRKTDGSLWLQFVRQKTGKKKSLPIQVPLDEKAQELIEKYKSHPECMLTGRSLPVNTNQDYNRQLKLIGVYLKLSFELKSHHMRKTAGMLWINGDVPLSTVAALLGDTEQVAKVHYARVIEEKIGRDMAAYAERVKQKKNTNSF